MSTLDQKRLLKLAGLLKEGLEEWPRGLAEEEEEVPKAKVGNLDVPMGYDVGEPEYKWEPPSDREAMESLYWDMYKELHNIRPRWVDFESLSDSELRKMILDLQDDIVASFESEKFDREREEEKLADERAISELEPSAEEEELERLPMHSGMGRRLEETYIDNLGSGTNESLEEAPPPFDPEERALKGLKPLEKGSKGEELDPFGFPLSKGEKLPLSALKAQAKHGFVSLEETIRALVREVLLEKKAKTYKGKSMRLGGGGRFAKFVDSLKKSGKSEEQARAIAYKAGAKKYGKEKMKKMAAAGKKRAAKKD